MQFRMVGFLLLFALFCTASFTAIVASTMHGQVTSEKSLENVQMSDGHPHVMPTGGNNTIDGGDPIGGGGHP